MSTSFEPSQYDRDFRSPNQERKQKKDALTKWKYGTRPAAGCGYDGILDKSTRGSNESHRAKQRPERRGWGHDPWKEHHNIVKTTRANYNAAPGLVRSKMSIGEELDAATRADIPAVAGPISPAAGQQDPFLYSFDRSVTPGRPLTLDVFVKAPTQRDTEKLVEREYEVVDENGRALKGQQARRNLRKSASDLKAGSAVADDGFELL